MGLERVERLVVSEQPPGAEWSATAAVARNRIIAALASAVIIVETQPAGGAMHTFRAAEALELPLFVVRYVKPPSSASGNSLAIAKGATALTRLSDLSQVIEAVGR